MKRYIVRQVLIVKLAALALSALSFLHAPVRAQGMAGYIVIFPSVGLARGERLRLTLFNPDGAPVRAEAQIRHTGGVLVGMLDGSVRAGAFHSFDFNRDDIPLVGEAGTGRLQLRASFHIRMDDPLRKSDGIAVSMETISILDGTSNTVFFSEAIPHSDGGGGRDILVGGDARDVLMGIVPGQTLRVTLFNPPSFEPGSEAQRKPVNGHVKVFDGSGNLIKQSDELAIPPGDFRSFDFNGDMRSLPAEPGTNRVQVRIRPFYDFRSARQSTVLASFEIVDNSTGKTEVLSAHECLVFFLGCIPAN